MGWNAPESRDARGPKRGSPRARSMPAHLCLVAGLVAAVTLMAPAEVAACGCHFLACGGEGTQPEPGTRTRQYWELGLRLSDDTLSVTAVRLVELNSPIVIAAGRGGSEVRIMRDGLALDRQAFSFAPGARSRIRNARTVVRVPYEPTATALRVSGPGGETATVELVPQLDTATNVLVHRLVEDLRRTRSRPLSEQ